MSDDDKDIRQEMADVFDKMQEDAPTSTPAGEASEELPSSPPTEASPTSDERPRDEHGRFVSADDAATEPVQQELLPTPEPAVAEPVTEPVQTEGAPVVEPENPGLDAPASWTPAAKAFWPQVVPEVKAEIARRETDLQRALTERGQKLKSFEGVDEALTPVMPALTQNFITPAQYINSLVQADMAMRRDPIATAKALVQQYGGDPSALTGPEPDEFSDEYTDPATAKLKQEVDQLKAQRQQEAEAAQQQQVQAIARQIEEFRPTAKYFDRVEADMSREAAAYRAAGQPMPPLQEMYDRAVWANPETRALAIAEQQQSTQAAEQAEKQRKVAEAKKLAETNLSSKGVAAGETPKPTSIRGSMEEAYDRMQSA